MTSELEEMLLLQIRNAGMPEPERELMFHPHRKWRFDFAWPRQKLAVEVNGAIYAAGRHSRGSGLESDYEKLNQAQIDGWRVLQFSRAMIESGEALAQVVRGLAGSPPVTGPVTNDI